MSFFKEIDSLIKTLKRYNRNDGESIHVKDELDELFEKHPKFIHPWTEFSESLITVQGPSQQEKAMANTIDSEHFFDLRRLFKGLTWHAAVPGILTGFGILGTFLGIILGLDEVDIEHIDKSIGNFVDGMDLAFITSAVGLGLAVFYNIAEKIILGKVENAIDNFNEQINRIYPRSTPDKFLAQILNLTEQQNSQLKHLATDIGDNIASSFAKIGLDNADISDTIKAGVSLGLEKLGDELKAFCEFQQTFTKQAEEINESTKNLALGLTQLTEANIHAGHDLLHASESVKEASSVVGQSASEIEQVTSATENLINLSNHSTERQHEIQESLTEVGTTLNSMIENTSPVIVEISEHIADLNKKLNERSEAFQKHLAAIHNTTQNSLESSYKAIDDSMAQAVRKLATGVGELHQIVEEIDSVTKSFVETMSQNSTPTNDDSDNQNVS
jgi:biopolymer transport protein ExbB/TolQ